MKKLIIYTDGGARGNPGPAGIGVVVQSPKSKVQSRKFSKYIGEATNNQAEYRALIFGLSKAKEFDANEIICFLDSELLVNQLTGKYKVKNRGLAPLVADVFRLTNKFKKVDFRYIPREKNKEADKLVNEAIDRSGH